MANRRPLGQNSVTMGDDERRDIPVSGWNACLALFERRPDDIRRILVEERKTKLLGHVLSWAAKKRLPYRVESSEELSRAAGTTHHEGIVMVAREKELLTAASLAGESFPEDACILAVESVGNPHNIGAILRTAAFFGVKAVVLGGPETPDRLSPAVLRTSQGGAESVRVFRSEDLAGTLLDLHEREFTVVGTDVHGKNVFARPLVPGAVVIVLGSERAGMSPAVRAACDRLVRVPGSGAVESLNVSVACGVFLALVGETRP
jgi:RNA methyltransferase, TrmH family